MTTPSLRCAWAEEPDKGDHDHEPDSLAMCDSWICSCGNHDHNHGFYPVEKVLIRDGRWEEADDLRRHMQCFKCGAVFTNDGVFVETAPIIPQQ
jgi:hypothetical protein